MAADNSMTPESFITQLSESGLLTSRAVRAALRGVPAEYRQSVDALARKLVDDNVITLFQAKHLLRGATKGLVLDDFEVRDFLGKGGMGSVYLAWDRKEDRPCALKVLLPGKRMEKRSVLRFTREIEVSQRLSHPGIAVAYRSGEAGGVHYLAMEYVPGITLYRWVKRRGVAPIYWASKWIATVARALDHAHQAGVIHRDIKPSNVIVRPDGEAKLLDMGLARWFEDDHNEQRVVGKRRIVGSFDYIAPEQAADSSRADARSDIYSLGCVLYFLLSGSAPFHHVAKTREKISHHMSVAAQPIEQRRPDIPPGYAVMVSKMLAKDPLERYQVCAEVADILGYWESRLAPSGPVDLSLFQPTETDAADEFDGSPSARDGSKT